jgi:hypothetical protein
VGNPGAVEAVVRLAGLVRADLGEGRLGDLGVAAVGDHGRHAAHREGTAVVAGLDQQFGVGAHERCRHHHGGAVRQHKLLTGVPEILDDAEQVVPASGVQAGSVVPQLVQDLVHLESGRDGLDQHRGADGALAQPQEILGEDKNVVPQAGLEVALHLGQVVVRALPVEHQLLGHVEEVQAEVHQAPTAGSPLRSRCFSCMCQPRGRATTTASGASVRSLYSLPSSEV